VSEQQDEIRFEGAPEKPVGPFQFVANLLGAIGTVWIFLLMFLIVADVIGRNFLNAPITGVAEIAGRSVVAIVFLQLAGAIGSGRMTRADFLLHLLSQCAPRALAVLEIFFALAGALLFAVLAYASWPEFAGSMQSDEFFGVQGVYTIPTWPFRGLLVLGAGMAAVAYLLAIPPLLRQASIGTVESR
jgi:TRAP-type C4-dicarboxylate transport system permease small subunit